MEIRAKMRIIKKDFIPIILGVFFIISFYFISPVDRYPRSQFHSSQLKKISTETEKCERIDYIDSSGMITVAADLGYATMTLTHIKDGTIEQYYDDKGKPISRYNGYYALLREYDEKGNNIRTTYLNQNGEPVIMANGYAIEEKEYNDKGIVEAVWYYDVAMNPILTPLYGYGELYERNMDGKIEKITYVDDSGTPVLTKQGYASVRRTYYSSDGLGKDKVKSEMYFGEKGDPIQLSLGQYGVQKEYDQYGRISELIYLDINGKPFVTNKGYTKIKRTYHANNSIATEQYYDIHGTPFSLPEGQYGISQDENYTFYLDKYGKKIFNIKNFLYNQSWIIIPMVIIGVVLCSIINKKWNYLFLAIYISILLYMTLLFRENNGTGNIGLFCQYSKVFIDSEARADIFKNIWLFVPLGAILYQIYPKRIVLVFAIVLSLLIESIQYMCGLGFCEFDDIISNSIGAIIGFFMGKLTVNYKQRINSWRHIHTI